MSSIKTFNFGSNFSLSSESAEQFLQEHLRLAVFFDALEHDVLQFLITLLP